MTIFHQKKLYKFISTMRKYEIKGFFSIFNNFTLGTSMKVCERNFKNFNNINCKIVVFELCRKKTFVFVLFNKNLNPPNFKILNNIFGIHSIKELN